MKILYILMRNDMTSMNPGKACAQAAHAANMFIKFHGEETDVIKWSNETKDGFGTTIVLACSLEQLSKIWYNAFTAGMMTGMVTDPSYPVQDGQVVHHVNIVTCGYVFGEKNLVSELTKEINLMP